MARTPSSKPVQALVTPSKTPQSKHRQQLTATKNTQPSPNPIFVAKENIPIEHPVEVIGRIRDYPDRKDKPFSGLQISSDGQTIRVRTDIGYRDFSLDGVSVSEDENLDEFYKKFVESRINGVKLGEKCTIMMYGPTGSGKSHTMFGCSKQPGIVYKALRDILGEGDDEKDMGNRGIGLGSFVQVTVLEIYNEEIYDLLSNNNGGGVSLGWPRGNASKVRLEVMGKKAKNATFISGNEAGKISREVAKVEKRRIVKSTLCNDRSSRSHCLIILDVPSVGGRLMLVDMAGSENIEQAGQIGFEAKMQTAKINQGNIALRRVVESIANGDSYVPFRDSKLTMLLQDSFEDDKSKILMILCASPDPKEMHKTICTLEYGAKAKCIVRATHTPIAKDKITSDDPSSLILGSRIAAMDQFIYKLQMENKIKEKERDEAHKELLRKEEEVAELRAKLTLMEGRGLETSEEEIKSKVDERTRALKLELEKKLVECQKKANDFVELGRRRMEEKILKQKEEVEMLRRRLEEIEFEISCSRNNDDESAIQGFDGSNFMKRLSEIYAEGDQGMEKSMDLDMGDQPIVHDVKEIDGSGVHQPESCMKSVARNTCWAMEEEDNIMAPKFTEKVCLSTVFEVEEEGQEDEEKIEEEEVEKEIIEDKVVDFGRRVDEFNTGSLVASRDLIHTPYSYRRDLEETDYSGDRLEKPVVSGLGDEPNNSKNAASARRTRIQNIFTLCGNHRELSQHVRTPTAAKRRSEDADVRSSPIEQGKQFIAKRQVEDLLHLQSLSQPEFRSQNSFTSDGSVRNITESPGEKKKMETLLNRRYGSEMSLESKENCVPGNGETDGQIEVYVKWEASKECPRIFVTKLKVGKNSSLADLRKLIETHLRENSNKQEFTFLMLGDPSGGPVAKEKEVTTHVSKLPIFNNQISCHLACLRLIKKTIERPNHLPFSSLENKLPFVLDSLLAPK